MKYHSFSKMLVITFGLLYISPALCENTIHSKVVWDYQITPYIKEITDLCLKVWREYPYLYDGTYEEYMPFIQGYADSAHGIACLLFDGNKLIGVAIGVPFSDMREHFKQAWIDQPYDITQFFYLAEHVLLKEYRHKGFGKRMYYEFEQAVRKTKIFKNMCFCAIEEPQEHPLKPTDYITLDQFRRNLGFTRHDELNFIVPWKNINEGNSPHRMVYWLKSLT